MAHLNVDFLHDNLSHLGHNLHPDLEQVRSANGKSSACSTAVKMVTTGCSVLSDCISNISGCGGNGKQQSKPKLVMCRGLATFALHRA